MGIDRSTLEFLLECRAKGIELGRTVTLGRQDFLVTYDHVAELLTKYGYAHTQDDITGFYERQDQFCEPVLEFIGADRVDSLDMSDFEGATITHDFNQPIPGELHGAFDTVIDGGTSEHVFNVFQSMQNCINLAKVGGHVISILPSNNFCGHGFYQFSPEFFYRVFSEENGFEVKLLIFCVFGGDDEWIEVVDPMVIRRRAEPRSVRPSSIMMLAEKIAEKPVFSLTPQQSDYNAEWEQKPAKGETLDRLHFWGGSRKPTPKNPVKDVLRRVKRSLRAAVRSGFASMDMHQARIAYDTAEYRRYPRR